MIRELAVYEKLEHEVSATLENLHKTLFNGSPFAEVFLLRENEKIAGMSLCFYSYSTFLAKPGLYLEDLFIKPAYRNRGYGKKMLAFLAKRALEKGCGRFEWSVLDWNEPAIQFYLKLGAKPMADWTMYRLTGDSLSELATRAF
jgi:GNAT superfamily N-acetyltransferase